MARRHGWSDEQLQDLAKFETRGDFNDGDKAALRLAEQMTTDSNGVDDAMWIDLMKYFDEGQVIELAAAIGLFNYFNRFNNALRMEPTK